MFWEDLSVGTALEPIVLGPITLRNLVQWAAASLDFHEIHYDLDYAKAQGLPGLVVHGPLKLALAGRLFMALAGEQGWLKRMNCRYLGIDVVNTTLTVEGKTVALRPDVREADLEWTVRNSEGATTGSGSATLVLPRREP